MLANSVQLLFPVPLSLFRRGWIDGIGIQFRCATKRKVVNFSFSISFQEEIILAVVADQSVRLMDQSTSTFAGTRCWRSLTRAGGTSSSGDTLLLKERSGGRRRIKMPTSKAPSRGLL